MRVFLTVALLVLAVTEAHHTPEHTLNGPRFSIGKVQVYDIEFNLTSGVLGLSSQVSKSAFKAELQIYAKNETEHILKVTKVYTSGSVKAVEIKDADVPMHKNSELESKLSIPIKFTLENGEVTSYTLSPRESLESKKIKKAILRSLEMQIPQDTLQQMESSKLSLRIPVVYNVTRNSGCGQHSARYMITVSPNVEFPYSDMVYNISRTENFEGERQQSLKLHHNLKLLDCSSNCKKEWHTSEYDGQCAPGHRRPEIPIKSYVQQDHHLVLEEGIMTPEVIKTVEVHNAKMYDQDMKVLIRHRIRKIGYSKDVIEDPTDQAIYTDLQDQEVEINEDEINDKCEISNSRESIEAAKRLLAEIAEIVVKGDLESKESTIVGEKIVLLRRALSKMKVLDFKELSREIPQILSVRMKGDDDRSVRRQIWMDILPLVGTNESVSFVISYIKENIGQDLLIWEAKEILESLAYNIHLPNENMIRELRTLLTLPVTRTNHLFYSAAHLCIVKVIRSMCAGTDLKLSNTEEAQRSSSNGRNYRNLRQASNYGPPECPEPLVTEILQDIIHNLQTTQKQDEIIISLDALSQTGAYEVLSVISEYAYGTAENLQRFGPSYIEFVKSAAINYLHGISHKFPEDVMKIVMPLFFNETESSKIRTAAFSLLIRSEPSLEILQHVASHSWSERSNEVGSFVTSTMSTFANSTLPCMQILARRIKQVMPMLKRFDIGLQHAKNLLWSHFDDDRMFGLRNHLYYAPNNASIIPSVMYYTLSYSTYGLLNTLFEGASLVEGISQKDVFRFIDRILDIPSIDIIGEEREIFEEAKILDRIPETLRFTLYGRMFYRSSHYYLDRNNLRTAADTLKEYLSAYLMKRSSDYSGHLVKVLLPSSFHTVTVAKSLPYPVEFQMDHPMVLALKIETKKRDLSLTDFHFVVRPSVYLSKLLTHQVKNIGDCKEVGVYHEQKLAISYPVEVKFQLLDNVTVQYKLPELPKRVLYYFTESGTYAERKDLEMLPSSKNRKPIRTLPSPFKHSTTVHLVALPPVNVEYHTEEIGSLVDELPSNSWEVLNFAIKNIMNSGWKYKSANISLEADYKVWPLETEVTFSIEHSRRHAAKGKLRMSQQQHSAVFSKPENEDILRNSEWMPSEQEHKSWPTQDSAHQEQRDTEPNDDSWNTEASPQQWFWDGSKKDEYADDKWPEKLNPSDISKNTHPSTFINQGKAISSILSSSVPHIYHALNINLRTWPILSFAYIKLEYNHTYSKSLHAVHMDAIMKLPNQRKIKQISVDHVMGYGGKPDEFQYNTHHDDQKALFITALRTHNADCSCPWKDMEVVAKGLLEYESLDNILNKELENSIERKFFLSKHHDQCIEDIKNGHSQSSSCMKAIKERSIYNKLTMSVLWNKNLPENVMNMARRLDAFMKHIYYHHMSIDYHSNTENRISVNLNYIDKLTVKPLFDATIKKPEETVTLRRVRVADLTLSSVHDILSLNLMKLTNNTYPPTCVMMEKSIRTYDDKYYPLSQDRCSYVLTTHCTRHKNFAIISKVLSTDGMKELHVDIGEHRLIVSPMSVNHYTIKYDSEDYAISEPLVFDEIPDEIYVFTENYGSEHKHLEIVAKRAGVRVLYDGKNVKVQIDPRYKGETCGLCSEFDGETIREFIGADKCLYSHSSDFANSAITNTATCSNKRLHPYICENTDMVWAQDGNTAKFAPSTKRNIVTVKGNDICFSVHPVPVCDSDSKPTETETLQVGFHCLPKKDLTAKRMVSEAKRRSLGEIENKSVDYEENVEVAKMC